MQPIARQGEQFNLTGERFPQRHPVDEEGLRGFLGGHSIQAGYNNRRQAGGAYDPYIGPDPTAHHDNSYDYYDEHEDDAAREEDQQGLGLHQLGEPPQYHEQPDELHEGPHDPWDEPGSLGDLFSPHTAPLAGSGPHGDEHAFGNQEGWQG